MPFFIRNTEQNGARVVLDNPVFIGNNIGDFIEFDLSRYNGAHSEGHWLASNNSFSNFINIKDNRIDLRASGERDTDTGLDIVVSAINQRVKFKIERSTTGRYKIYVDNFQVADIPLSSNFELTQLFGTGSGEIYTFIGAFYEVTVSTSGGVVTNKWTPSGNGLVLEDEIGGNDGTLSGPWPTDDTQYAFYDGGTPVTGTQYFLNATNDTQYVEISDSSLTALGGLTDWELEFRASNNSLGENVVLGRGLSYDSFVILRANNNIDLRLNDGVSYLLAVTDVTDTDAVYRLRKRIDNTLEWFENEVSQGTINIPDGVGLENIWYIGRVHLVTRGGRVDFINFTNFAGNEFSRYYNANSSQGTGDILDDSSVNAQNGILRNYPTDDSQWGSYQVGVGPVLTPVLRSIDAQFQILNLVNSAVGTQISIRQKVASAITANFSIRNLAQTAKTFSTSILNKVNGAIDASLAILGKVSESKNFQVSIRNNVKAEKTFFLNIVTSNEFTNVSSTKDFSLSILNRVERTQSTTISILGKLNSTHLFNTAIRGQAQQTVNAAVKILNKANSVNSFRFSINPDAVEPVKINSVDITFFINPVLIKLNK